MNGDQYLEGNEIERAITIGSEPSMRQLRSESTFMNVINIPLSLLIALFLILLLYRRRKLPQNAG